MLIIHSKNLYGILTSSLITQMKIVICCNKNVKFELNFINIPIVVNSQLLVVTVQS